MAASLPPPSLQQALVVALLLRRRCAAADSEARRRCAQLEGEVEALRAAAAAPSPPQPLLAALVDLPAACGAAASPGAAPLTPSEEAVQQQSEVVALWHRAAAALPPHLQPALAQAQRYLLLAELRQPSGSGALPLAAALEHTPVQALLELAANILQAHAAAAAAPAPQQQQQAPTAPVQLSPAHAQLLGGACEALVHLCERPGETAAPPDYQLLQQFGQMLLHAVAAPDQPAAPGMHPAAAAPPAAAPAAAAGAPVDLQQPPSAVAAHMLAVLRQSSHAGLTLLGCTAPAVRDTMAALVEAVNGEGPALPPPSSDAGSAAASCGGHLGGGGGAAAAAEEARLLHAFTQLGHQLSAGLRLLPAWLKAADIAADAFLQASRAERWGGEEMCRRIGRRRPAQLPQPPPASTASQDTAAAVVAARDLSQLVSVTHPAAARHMQRWWAQMVGALQQIAANDQHMQDG